MHVSSRISFSSNCIVKVLLPLVVVFCAQTALAEDDIHSKWEGSPHADAASESFIHWDEVGKIPADCATCHSGTGFQDFLGNDGSTVGKTDKDHATGSLVDCETCHNDSAKKLTSVEFPSGVTVEGIESSVQCMVCHQGRSSTQAVDKKLEALADDKVDPSLGFINIHYRAAAATMFGSEVMGGYQYDGLEYEGRFNHVPGLNTCSSCHDAHSLEVKTADCATCHVGEGGVANIRTSVMDFDGDTNNSEGIAAEIETLHSALGEAIMEYGSSVTKSPIIYAAGSYPYYFNDLNSNGQVDDKESIYPNRYQSWTPRLLRAAYNYQFAAVDTGAYAHNPKYVIQLLYDSLADLGADSEEFSRP